MENKLGEARILAFAEEFAEDFLDDLVHEAKSEEAAAINNNGVLSQVRYLLEYGFTEDEIRGQYSLSSEGLLEKYEEASGNTVKDGLIYDGEGTVLTGPGGQPVCYDDDLACEYLAACND